MARVKDLWHNRDRTRSSIYGQRLRWQAIWTESGTERKRAFPTKAAAEEHLIWVGHQQKSGAYVSADRSRIFIRELLPEWEKSLLHLKASTRAATASDVRATIGKYWGARVLADVRREHIQEWVSGIGKAPRTVDTIYGRFHSFLGWCVAEGRLATNPAVGINLPRGKKRPHLFLTVEQVRTLAGTIEAHYSGLVWLLATTGLRMGEACELRVRDVDFARRRLNVARSIVFVGGKPVVDTPKNHKTRTVPLTALALEVLAEKVEGRPGDDLIFTTARGRQVRANNFKRRQFNDAVIKVNAAADERKTLMGVDDGVRLPAKLWVHDLRHTAASWAVASGGSVKSVQRMLGHATAAMTLDVYAGLFDQDLDDVADRMDALIAGSAKPGSPENRPTAQGHAA